MFDFLVVVVIVLRQNDRSGIAFIASDYNFMCMYHEISSIIHGKQKKTWAGGLDPAESIHQMHFFLFIWNALFSHSQAMWLNDVICKCGGPWHWHPTPGKTDSQLFESGMWFKVNCYSALFEKSFI